MNQILALIARAVANVVAFIFGPGPRLPRPARHPTQTQRRSLSVEVVRPDDLLALTLDFYNLRLGAAGAGAPPRLERDAAGHGFVVARFPPQSFAERAFYEATPGVDADASEPLEALPVPTRIAGPSELVFRVTDALLPAEFTLESILDLLARAEQVVRPTLGRPAGTPPLGWPVRFGGERSKFTAVEAPYRLVLSPNLESRWQHALGPVTDAAGGRTELWHTRLDAGASAGVVWSPDYAAGDPPPDDRKPFRMSLEKSHRHRIVRSSSDPSVEGAAHVGVNQLMLSSQGAWLSVHGRWQSTLTGLNLEEWRHIMTAGRDQYARVVEPGNMFCLGHRAVLVTITERKVEMAVAGRHEGKPVAYLRQVKKVFIREPTKAYAHRQMPFRSVTFKTLVTPNLDPPEETEILPGKAGHAFWPRAGGEDFLFHLVATDWEGRESEFHMPLAFVVQSIAARAPTPNPEMAQIINLFNAADEAGARRRRPLGGQKVAYAPWKEPGDTTLETFAWVFGASGARGGLPHFLPLMMKAETDVPAARQLSGDPAPSTIALDPQFLAGSGDAIGNLGEVFAYLVKDPPRVKFTADQTGGLVAPDFSIRALSRGFGPVGGDPAKFAGGAFNPADIFKGVKILGGVDLASIVADAVNATPDAAGLRIPRLKSVRRTAAVGGVAREVVETSYRWRADEPFLLDTGMFRKKPGSEFAIEAVVQAPLDGSPPAFEVAGRLTKFAVVLLPGADLVAIHFDSVAFGAGSGRKVDFAAVFDDFEFLGPLRFVNKLREVIPADGFDDPPFLNLHLPRGLNVGFTQGVPTVGLGIFTLQNISFGAGFYLPFLGDEANLSLAFCRRHQPFILTVSLFGGGGFFGMEIGFGGVRMVEAALEFGAAVALNLGVAKGQASVMGGVYYQKSGDGFAFSAYFRAAGSLSVLGIISVSVELYISLNYESRKNQPHGGKLWGQASLTVKIKIAFFSISVKLSIEREFAGSDPKFVETVTPADWSQYCAAFADYPA